MEFLNYQSQKNVNISLSGKLKDTQSFSISRAEKLLNFKFLPQLIFTNWQVEHTIKKLCLKAQKRKFVNPSALWLGKFHKHHISNPPEVPLSVAWINSHIGYGVFALEDLPAWTYIGEYTGILRRRTAIWLDENDYCFRYPLPFYHIKYFTIDSGKQGNITRFINHSDKANTEAIGVLHNDIFHIIIRTIKPIFKGEEICYHYGPLYWKHRKKKSEFVPIEI